MKTDTLDTFIKARMADGWRAKVDGAGWWVIVDTDGKLRGKDVSEQLAWLDAYARRDPP